MSSFIAAKTRAARIKAVVGAAMMCAAVGSLFMFNRVSTSSARARVATARIAPNDLRANYHRPTSVDFPEDNQFTEARAELGKALFFDPRLSKSGSTSCATCHNPSFAWGDGLARGTGFEHKKLGRRTPTILNCAYGSIFFWDGRADTLEHQALGPIASPGEMNMPLTDMIGKVDSIPGYKQLFEKAYPGEPISKETVAKAIATYERTVISSDAPFDRWVLGDENAISASAKHGFQLFNTTADCVKCHSGWNFTDDSFHDIGVPDDDIGRGKFLADIPIAQHAFKTPGLRNITLRGPYMHNGSEKTLNQVVEFYNQGGFAHRPSQAPEVHPLNLSESDKQDIVEFLKTLTSNDPPVTLPVLPQ